MGISRAGALQANNDHRRQHLLVENFRVFGYPRLYPQTVDQNIENTFVLPEATCRIQVRFFVQRLDQHGHGLAKAVVAKITQPGGLTGGGQQRVYTQLDLGNGLFCHVQNPYY